MRSYLTITTCILFIPWKNQKAKLQYILDWIVSDVKEKKN